MRATAGISFYVPSNVFSPGDMISIFNDTSGNITVVANAGTAMYNTADAATGNRTLAARGMCTIVCTSSNHFAISGSQLT